MKTRQDVYPASEAGYIQYESLPIIIETNTWIFMFAHAPRIVRSEVSADHHEQKNQWTTTC